MIFCPLVIFLILLPFGKPSNYYRDYKNTFYNNANPRHLRNQPLGDLNALQNPFKEANHPKNNPRNRQRLSEWGKPKGSYYVRPPPGEEEEEDDVYYYKNQSRPNIPTNNSRFSTNDVPKTQNDAFSFNSSSYPFNNDDSIDGEPLNSEELERLNLKESDGITNHINNISENPIPSTNIMSSPRNRISENNRKATEQFAIIGNNVQSRSHFERPNNPSRIANQNTNLIRNIGENQPRAVFSNKIVKNPMTGNVRRHSIPRLSTHNSNSNSNNTNQGAIDEAPRPRSPISPLLRPTPTRIDRAIRNPITENLPIRQAYTDEDRPSRSRNNANHTNDIEENPHERDALIPLNTPGISGKRFKYTKYEKIVEFEHYEKQFTLKRWKKEVNVECFFTKVISSVALRKGTSTSNYLVSATAFRLAFFLFELHANKRYRSDVYEYDQISLMEGTALADGALVVRINKNGSLIVYNSCGLIKDTKPSFNVLVLGKNYFKLLTVEGLPNVEINEVFKRKANKACEYIAASHETKNTKIKCDCKRCLECNTRKETRRKNKVLQARLQEEFNKIKVDLILETGMKVAIFPTALTRYVERYQSELQKRANSSTAVWKYLVKLCKKSNQKELPIYPEIVVGRVGGFQKAPPKSN